MAVRVDFIFLSLFYDHPFVTEEGGNFNCFVMSQLNVLQCISFLQPFQIIVITGNTEISLYGSNGSFTGLPIFFSWG